MDFKRRFSEHRGGAGKQRHCCAWERALIGKGLCCEATVIEERQTNEEACERERWWIAYGRRWGWPLTNHTDGGEGSCGCKPSPETREKISQANRGRKRSPETRENISRASKGRVFSPETRQKLSEATQKQFSTPEARGRVSEAIWEYCSTPEAQEQMHQARAGRALSSEHKEKISEALTGHTVSTDTRKKIGDGRRRAVACPNQEGEL